MIYNHECLPYSTICGCLWLIPRHVNANETQGEFWQVPHLGETRKVEELLADDRPGGRTCQVDVENQDIVWLEKDDVLQSQISATLGLKHPVFFKANIDQFQWGTTDIGAQNGPNFVGPFDFGARLESPSMMWEMQTAEHVHTIHTCDQWCGYVVFLHRAL